MTSEEARELTEEQEKTYVYELPEKVNSFIQEKIIPDIKKSIQLREYLNTGKKYYINKNTDIIPDKLFGIEFEKQMKVLGYETTVFAFKLSIAW